MSEQKQTRWMCTNSHCKFTKTILGPIKPRRDHCCRFCLECSMHATHLVKRVAVTLEKKRSTQREQEREARAKAREEKKQNERNAKQMLASDYGVIVDGKSIGTYDKLRGKGGALAEWRRCRRAYGDEQSVELTRIHLGRAFMGIFHGLKFVHWLDNETLRIEHERS